MKEKKIRGDLNNGTKYERLKKNGERWSKKKKKRKHDC